jgi:hypothetical protein
MASIVYYISLLLSTIILLLIPLDAFAMGEVVAAVSKFATKAGFSITPQGILISIAINLAMSMVMKALAPKPKQPNISQYQPDIDKGQTVTFREALATRKVIYGKTRVSGPIVYVETTENKKYMHLVIVLAAHEIQSFDQFWVNDEQVSINSSTGSVNDGGKFDGKIRYKLHLGADNQSADSDLVSESDGKWTSEHQIKGVAYVYVRLEHDQSVFSTGVPNLSFVISGKKVYDTRDATTAFKSNPALCFRDYMTNSTYGLGCSDSEIDDTAITVAANACDEDVTLASGATENRFECHGALDTDKTPKANIESLLSSMIGIMTYSGGVFTVKAGVYQSPSVTITEDDMVASYSIDTKQSRREAANGVKGTFMPEDSNFIAADYPPITSTTFVDEDGGIENLLDFTLPMTKSPTMAQRIAKIALYRGREQLSLNVKTNLKNAFTLQVGDNVQVTIDRLGFSSKVFTVAGWSMILEGNPPALVIDLKLREISSAVYSFSTSEEKAFTANNTILANPFTLSAPSLSLSDTLKTKNQQILTVLVAEVGTDDNFNSTFEVEAKKTTESTYVSLGTSSSGKFELVNAEDQTIYDVRARGIGSFGQRSAYTSGTHFVQGKTAVPSDVTDFAVNIVGSEAHLSWTPVSDLDLSHYRIRHSDATTGATFSSTITLIDKVPRPANSVVAPALTGTYFIKAVDKLGFVSANPDSIVAIVGKVENETGYGIVSTSQQDTSFTGTHDDTVATGTSLILDTTNLFDAASGNFDSGSGLFDGGAGAVEDEGTYTFNAPIDLGAKYTSRMTIEIATGRLDYVVLFDDEAGNFDTKQGNFDGDITANDDTDVQVFVATTDDDPASGGATFTAFRKFTMGDYTARGFKFKAVLSSNDFQASPEVTKLRVHASMPFNTVFGNDIASTTASGGKAVTFASEPNGAAFHTLKSVTISGQNLASGDYFVVSSKANTGFTIHFRNSSNAVVDRTFDYVAIGMGQLAS